MIVDQDDYNYQTSAYPRKDLVVGCRLPILNSMFSKNNFKVHDPEVPLVEARSFCKSLRSSSVMHQLGCEPACWSGRTRSSCLASAVAVAHRSSLLRSALMGLWLGEKTMSVRSLRG
jgi:hypothetical protein